MDEKAQSQARAWRAPHVLGLVAFYRHIRDHELVKLRVTIALIGVSMTAVSWYLTQHYFAVRFAQGLAGDSLCQINSYFNCDRATESPVAQIFDAPIAFLGMMIGAFVVLAALIRKHAGTLFVILLLNFLGCLGLLAYSLLELRSLCPFCTGYYFLSAVALFLLHKWKTGWQVSAKVLVGYAAAILVVGMGYHILAMAKARDLAAQGPGLAAAFDQLPTGVAARMSSPFKLASSPRAIIKMAVFSDFECPGCRGLAQKIAPLRARYGDKLDIEYFFFPLDSACNPWMSVRQHPFACRAAWIAACLPNDFDRVHDEIFENQENFSDAWFENYARKNGVSDCMEKDEVKQQVAAVIKASEPVVITSTPTLVVNGTKLKGAPSLHVLVALFDELIRRAEGKAQ